MALCALALVGATLNMTSCMDKKNENPFFSEYTTPHQTAPFDKIKIEHYEPALLEGIKQHQAEIDAIVTNQAEPTFDNTIVALDRTGMLLERVSGVFFNVLEADGNDEMNAIAEQVSPMLSELSDGIILNDQLFQRVKAVYDQREQLGLNAEQMRLTTETYKMFADNGANLPADKKERLKEINKELGLLSLQFGNNVVAETNAYQYFVTDEGELKGLPESAKAADK
jgi:peptidyl-dipeptidase Dcp